MHSGEGLRSDTPFLRTIKTFVTRAGRATSGQLRAIEDLGPRTGIGGFFRRVFGGGRRHARTFPEEPSFPEP
jgi:hypothetical protein